MNGAPAEISTLIALGGLVLTLLALVGGMLYRQGKVEGKVDLLIEDGREFRNELGGLREEMRQEMRDMREEFRLEMRESREGKPPKSSAATPGFGASFPRPRYGIRNFSNPSRYRKSGGLTAQPYQRRH